MLGPASLIISSCKSNSSNDSQQKESLLYIIVVAKPILLGQEVLVLYSGCYFGPNRINCQRAYVEVEFHGADQYVFATKTRSSKVFADEDDSCDESPEDGALESFYMKSFFFTVKLFLFLRPFVLEIEALMPSFFILPD